MESIHTKNPGDKETTSGKNQVETQPLETKKVGAVQFYRLKQMLISNFSPGKKEDEDAGESPIGTNCKTKNPEHAIRHIRSEEPLNSEIPFYIWLVDIVKGLWLRATRFFHDFWF